MKRSDAFPSQYLGKDDVQSPIVATIDYVTMEKIKGEHGEDNKPVVFFKGDVKPMILNGINWSSIEERYGDESDNWRGQQIELYLDPNVMFGAKRVGGVRVRIPTGNRPAPASAPAPVTTAGSAQSRPQSRASAAWASFQAANPGLSRQQLVEPWKALLERLYPGQDHSLLGDDQWEQVQAEIESPIPL